MVCEGSGMTNLSWTLLVLAGLVAILDWFAVAGRWKALEYVAKPTTTALILAIAATLDVVHDATWWWFTGALVFCLLGDVFLMLPTDSFVQGLASFAVAQVMFAVGFTQSGTSMNRWTVGFAAVIPVALLLGRRFVGGIRRSGLPEYVVPVAVYMVVIATMATGSVASGRSAAVAGAAVFMLSDSLIAESRFVTARTWHPVAIMVTYHLALVGLVVSLLQV